MAIAVIAPTASRGLDRAAADSLATSGRRPLSAASQSGAGDGPGAASGRGSTDVSGDMAKFPECRDLPASDVPELGAVTGVPAAAPEVTAT